jgi:Flp pilus assembly pilin Flp
MRKIINTFLSDERGNAALEYALVLAAVGLGLITAVSALSETLGEIYQTITAGLATIGGGSPG